MTDPPLTSDELDQLAVKLERVCEDLSRDQLVLSRKRVEATQRLLREMSRQKKWEQGNS